MKNRSIIELIVIFLAAAAFFLCLGLIPDSGIPRNSEDYRATAQIIGVQKIDRFGVKSKGEIPRGKIAAGVIQDQTELGLKQIALGHAICQVTARHKDGLIIWQTTGLNTLYPGLPCDEENVGKKAIFKLKDVYTEVAGIKKYQETRVLESPDIIGVCESGCK